MYFFCFSNIYSVSGTFITKIQGIRLGGQLANQTLRSKECRSNVCLLWSGTHKKSHSITDLEVCSSATTQVLGVFLERPSCDPVWIKAYFSHLCNPASRMMSAVRTPGLPSWRSSKPVETCLNGCWGSKDPHSGIPPLFNSTREGFLISCTIFYLFLKNVKSRIDGNVNIIDPDNLPFLGGNIMNYVKRCTK